MNRITATIIGGILVISSVQIGDKVVTTESEWREEIQKVQLDIRKPQELQDMLISHQEKYERTLKEDKAERCPECIRYELEQDLRVYNLSARELERELDKQVAEALDRREKEIEDLANAIQQIEKAIEYNEN